MLQGATGGRRLQRPAQTPLLTWQTVRVRKTRDRGLTLPDLHRRAGEGLDRPNRRIQNVITSTFVSVTCGATSNALFSNVPGYSGPQPSRLGATAKPAGGSPRWYRSHIVW